MWRPQAWQSEKFGRSLVFFRRRSGDESEETAESDAEAAPAVEAGLRFERARSRFREGGMGLAVRLSNAAEMDF